MTYADGMPVDRLSVTVSAELGAALRALAEQRGETVSTVVQEAIAHQIRLAALDVALAEADRRFGPVPDRDMADAELTFKRAAQRASRKRR
jgi:predicted transcriptional regulator